MAHHIEGVEINDAEEYDENADEDFNPDTAAGEEDASSSDDDEAETAVAAPKKGAKKRKSDAVTGDLDSGDEATINERKSKKRRRKGGSKDDDAAVEEDEDSAGEGGLVKTRAQRLAEKVERKQRRRQTVGEVTIDVDSVWAELAGLPVGRQRSRVGVQGQDGAKMDVDGSGENKENVDHAGKRETAAQDDGVDMITITRHIEYAGEVTEITERVPRNSKEAQQYLATHPQTADSAKPTKDLQRPLKRPSLFEPNPTGLIKNVPPTHPILRSRPPSRADVLLAGKRAADELERKRKAERMTTVQKSALDWKGFVEGEEGLKEELEGYGRSKKTFLERENFLGRVEMAREGMGREARLMG